MTTNAFIDTPIGIVTFSSNTDVSSNISVKEHVPNLPKGMHTEFCCAALLTVDSHDLVANIQFEVILAESCKLDGPESGEALEAYSWTCENHVVYVGTEDVEVLVRRIGPSTGFDENSAVATAVGNRMTATIPGPVGGWVISLHLVLAVNPNPEPTPDSCWFAVDVPHKKLMVIE